MNVRKNLVRFLLQVRGLARYRATYFWMDALCVDQTDDEERTHQVEMMASIYSSAMQVLVWLGPSYSGSDLAMSTLARNGKVWTEAKMNRFWSIAEGTGFRGLCERRYWTRLWVVQELVRAKEVVMCCGSKLVSWSTFESFLSSAHRYCPSTRLGIITDYTATMGSNAVAMVRQIRDINAEATLFKRIVSFGHLECLDPRDKVYALLGTVQDDPEPIVPDYTIGLAALLNTVIQNYDRDRPGVRLQDWKERCEQLAEAIGVDPNLIFLPESASTQPTKPSLQELQDCSLEDEASGISLWWTTHYKHERATHLWSEAHGRAQISALFASAAAFGSKAACELLVQIGKVDLNHIDAELRTAMHRAAENGHSHIVKYLMEDLGVRVDVHGFHGATPMGAAVHRGHADIVRMLLAKSSGKIWNLKSYKLLLAHAVKRGHSSMWTYLTEVGKEQDFEPFDQATLREFALLAVENCHILCQAGKKQEIQPSSQASLQESALLSVESGHDSLMTHLVPIAACQPPARLKILKDAVAHRSDRLILALLNALGFPIPRDFQDLLEIAARRPRTTGLSQLLRVALFEYADRKLSSRPCGIAAYEGNLPALRIYLDHAQTHGDRRTLENFAQKALLEGARGGQVGIVDFMLRTHSEILNVDGSALIDAQSPLHEQEVLIVAMRLGDHAMVDMLLSLYPNISLDFRSGNMKAALNDVVARGDVATYHTLHATGRLMPDEPWALKLRDYEQSRAGANNGPVNFRTDSMNMTAALRASLALFIVGGPRERHAFPSWNGE